MASFNQTAGTRTQARNNTQAIVVTAMCIALTYIFTAVVNIRLPFAPNGGLIHLGNVPLFLAAIIFGKKTGALAVPSVWDSLTCSPAGLHGLHSLSLSLV